MFTSTINWFGAFTLLKIEVLQKEYDVTLQKYQEAVQKHWFATL